MQYRLRTLLLVAALGPPVLAGVIAVAVLLYVRWALPTNEYPSGTDYSFLCAVIPAALTIAYFLLLKSLKPNR